MDASEPRMRRRGFFLHSESGEPDTGEHENPEGLILRVRIARFPARQRLGFGTRGVPGTRFSTGRQSRTESGADIVEDGRPAIRSGSVTGSRQRAHMPR
jgi:hypothetical protein